MWVERHVGDIDGWTDGTNGKKVVNMSTNTVANDTEE